MIKEETNSLGEAMRKLIIAISFVQTHRPTFHCIPLNALVAKLIEGRIERLRCGGRRMVETAALFVDEVLPRAPIRQWVLSLPFALRYLLATRPEVLTRVLGIV